MLEIALIILVIMAIFTVQTRRLRNAVIYLGVFSLSISFVYMLYHAPDVAIAEAVIGSTIATILYLVAFQKYKIFTIYYLLSESEFTDQHYFSGKKQQLVKLLEKFCTKHELEAQFIYTVESLEHIQEKHQYALIIDTVDDHATIYGHPENYKIDALELFFQNDINFKTTYTIVKMEEVIM